MATVAAALGEKKIQNTGTKKKGADSLCYQPPSD